MSKLTESECERVLPPLRCALERLTFLEKTWDANPNAQHTMKEELLNSIETQTTVLFAQQDENKTQFAGLVSHPNRYAGRLAALQEQSKATVKKLASLIVATHDPTEHVDRITQARRLIIDSIQELVNQLETSGEYDRFVERVKRMQSDKDEYEALKREEKSVREEIDELKRSTFAAERAYEAEVATLTEDLHNTENTIVSLTKENQESLDYLRRKLQGVVRCQLEFEKQCLSDR